MIERVISGGQTGADLAGWKAAKACGIPTGGFMPAGFWAEDRAHPEYAALYGAVELPGARGPDGLRARTRKNVESADAVLIFGNTKSAGSRCTIGAARDHGKRWVPVTDGETRPSAVFDWLRQNPPIRVLMVAGNRESTSPGIGERVELFLVRVFARLKNGGGDGRRAGGVS